MKPAHIPRYLPPPQGVSASECAWRIRCAPRPRCRNASTGLAPSKPRVLEKPAKFRPPSHPQRLVKQRTPRQYPGPPLSEVQRAEQRIKRYPNMMPAEGTFMFWFLNSRLLHMGITLGVLFSLAAIVSVENFHRSTPFVDMLPPGREFWSHPFKFAAAYGHVYKLHTDHISAETAERRQKKADDVQKRSRYRKAHGLEDQQGFGGWTAKSDAELLGPALPSQDFSRQVGSPVKDTSAPDNAEISPEAAPTAVEDDHSAYVEPARRKRPVKRWLGIWE
ncbi:MAG: hypothetical protein L6R41_002868 [Letrouitia leprolyta]|nr:MAG: hypothetical protein L6R41_002868 [Letrouitia leprolyta]